MTDRQRKIDLVRRCFELTKSSFEPEARLAREKAIELMKKWGLTSADLQVPRKTAQRAPCPGCPNCQPFMRPGMRVTWIRFDISSGSGTTTTSNATYW